MTINWPSSLPQTPMLQSTIGGQYYDETAPDAVLRTQMDAGPAKVRQRFTSGVRPISFPLLLGATDLQTLDDFFTTTTYYGSLSFVITNPRTGAIENWRFVGPPKYTAVSGDLFDVQLNFEILP